ncbi:Histidine kinase-, DNA gyrase B-, and HSP90-like ATPase [Candidatus Pantoea symbiotica]|jgi:hypothetical protein|uniref:Histidine kinase-, DNA gyrase B-, and HSP90-like ATPase n=1 Tax=Candidatus Pantoea symbiotica TaxID=1884370 RepID=A0A1I3SNV0_9GAMM|nr:MULTISPECIES: ATP-binding protein [Pantoea]SFJ59882.1 Histidine kinase-, DNA gyrase B-, and HSP90-like ATPase [Pantoea symbiotica]SFU55248.1 Histidine kinase-, DNA gyrase B-, and HSP90-like ATPase [Pantoea sp. YR525]
MKHQVGTLDAVPSKRLFLSIIADYDLNKSICELIDNSFDVWTRNGRRNSIEINITLNKEQGVISVEDNAGGLSQNELKYIVSPGHTGSSSTDQTIGIFGVGTKRAVVALASDIQIQTRYKKEQTYQVEFDDNWLDDEEWILPLFTVGDIDFGSTRVELKKLRIIITDDLIEKLHNHLRKTYGKLLTINNVYLKLNDKIIDPEFFDNWSYPPNYEPRRYHGILTTDKKRNIDVEVIAGLSNESSPGAGEYGVYFYCNDRLVAPAMKSFDVGFTKGQAGLPHPKLSLTKVIVSMQGDASEMPWNSSKSDINVKHHVFIALHDWLVQVVKEYATLSRLWMGEWPDKVFSHDKGSIIDVPIENFINVKKSFLPDPPKSRMRLAEKIAKKNERLSIRKPWTKGLYEGVVASVTLSKQPLSQANWLAYSLLGITLKSALKEFVVNEINCNLSDQDIKKLLNFKNGKLPEKIKELITLPDLLWGRVENILHRQENLLYSRTTPSVSPNEFIEAKEVTSEILKKLFKLDTKD